MKRLDYSEAMIWYGEGVADCNRYSIHQLTKIWLIDESLRSSMNYVMSKCLACLNDRATEAKDTASINQLILYYTEGIGTFANENTANFWREQLETIISSYSLNRERPVRDDKEPLQTDKGKNRIDVFIGYSANVLAPAGLTFGVVGKYVGGYVRYRTNLSFQKYTEICDGKGDIEGLGGYFWLENKKANATLVTGGLVFRPTRNFLISAGAGYWKRDLMYEFGTVNLTETKREEDKNFWAKNKDYSFEGLAIDLDGTFRIGKVFYISAGCSFMDFKYAYGNAGIGVFF
jgi:hypothetical protein